MVNGVRRDDRVGGPYQIESELAPEPDEEPDDEDGLDEGEGVPDDEADLVDNNPRPLFSRLCSSLMTNRGPDLSVQERDKSYSRSEAPSDSTIPSAWGWLAPSIGVPFSEAENAVQSTSPPTFSATGDALPTRLTRVGLKRWAISASPRRAVYRFLLIAVVRVVPAITRTY